MRICMVSDFFYPSIGGVVRVAMRRSSEFLSGGSLKQPSVVNFTGESSLAVRGVCGVQGFESKSDAVVFGSSSDYSKKLKQNKRSIKKPNQWLLT